MKRSSSTNGGILGCTCYVIILLIGLLIGGIASNYLIATLFNANIPFIFDEIIGILLGSVIVPIAIVVWILKYFKVF